MASNRRNQTTATSSRRTRREESDNPCLEIAVTSEELSSLKEWLGFLAAGGDAEASGNAEGDRKAETSARALAEYVEQEGLRGTNVLVALGAVPVFVEAIMEADSKRMLEALMGAVAGSIPGRKTEALRALVAMGHVDDSHRGSIAGSGILGVLAAVAVQSKHPPRVRCLAFEAIGLFASDDDVTDGSDDDDATRQRQRSPADRARRRDEFRKLRAQVLSVGAVDRMVACLDLKKGDADVSLCIAAAGAIARLAPSHDTHPAIRRSRTVARCLTLLRGSHDDTTESQSESQSPPASVAEEVDGDATMMRTGDDDSMEDVGDDFDRSFAWERPALRVLVGIAS
eukprot:CAMPEP_0185763656 /NCGR_PEP_ID=MMETSP1174-20130828/22569_1 /TAXON_ID=35687 /ORGANISM="Dictyocha speculum, Strain CCMP1381" /LENGTH=341 /DNA_ID=CAMNT_0028445855 /DNA_START=71 /DNA_END=1092 /DNA_ORIENTATION=+